MKKGREVRNKPVIDRSSGKLLGYAEGLALGQDQRVRGLSVNSPDNEKLFVPLEGISQLGADAVLVDEVLSGLYTGEYQGDNGETYTGSLVLTASGRNLGTVADIVIEEKDGLVVGYEVTDGYLKDIMLGRKIIPVSQVMTYGEETFIVRDDDY